LTNTNSSVTNTAESNVLNSVKEVTSLATEGSHIENGMIQNSEDNCEDEDSKCRKRRRSMNFVLHLVTSHGQQTPDDLVSSLSNDSQSHIQNDEETESGNQTDFVQDHFLSII
ncbi:hypothetical protein L9F63_001990, partial [Diploptera punctata]